MGSNKSYPLLINLWSIKVAIKRSFKRWGENQPFKEMAAERRRVFWIQKVCIRHSDRNKGEHCSWKAPKLLTKSFKPGRVLILKMDKMKKKKNILSQEGWGVRGWRAWGNKLKNQKIFNITKYITSQNWTIIDITSELSRKENKPSFLQTYV